MDENLRQLLAIVRCVLNNEAYDEPINDDKRLFIIAQENGLSGLIAPVLRPHQLSPKIYSLFQQTFLQYTARDIRQQQAIQELNQLFNENGIKHIFLKGSYLKKLYPASYMRSMGDIDILVTEDELPVVHQILEKHGYINTTNSYQHDSFKKGKDIYIEIHPRLTSSFRDKYIELFNNLWEHTYLVDKYEYQFKPEFNLVYLLYHMAKHFSTSGVGLRTILDIGIFTKYHNDLDLEYLNSLLDISKLRLFFQNILYLNKLYFDYNYLEYYLKDYKIDEVFITELTNYIIITGVHGHGKDFNMNLSGMITKSLDTGSIKKGKFAYILTILFPSLKNMKGRYQFLNKCPFLLPLAWIFRFIRLLFKKTKASFIRLKQLLRVSDQEINKNYELFKKLGL